MNKRFPVFLILLELAVIQVAAQQDFIHPRGIINQNEVLQIREKVKREPFKIWFEKIQTSTESAEAVVDYADPYAVSYLALKQAQMHILTGENMWAGKSYSTLQKVIHDSLYNDPISRGLTRATLLFCTAMCYDFCFNAWQENQRKEVAEKLFHTMITVNSNMGFSANYALESNWNGVRWGSTLLAALVYDDLKGKYDRNPALPFIWDIQKRLKDHIERNIFPGGWSAESLSYHVYNWSFIAPALAALQNSSDNPVFELGNYAPHAVRTLWGWSAASVSIPHPGGLTTQPDLSDDDPQGSYILTAFGLRLYPEDQLPAIKWMHDYLLDVERISDDRGFLFYSVCWYPENMQAENPEQTGWTTFVDSTYGVAVWRNRFRDENDVVVAFSAPLKRVSGHKGPDNLTFRIIGNGNIWVTGAGRTGEVAGQTNLFPSKPSVKEKEPDGPQESHSFKTWKEEGYYYASAEGSSLGVKNHKRKIEVEFQNENSALIKINDTSENGKIWRLNTPEFNEVEIVENGFILIAPNGSQMKVTAPSEQIKGQISVTKVRYGGSTSQHNRGVGFADKYWEFNNAVDIPCKGNLDVRIEFNAS
ncbi:MAG: hypothetical protein ACP5D9_01780 [Mariniphaga sp.]